MGCGCWSLERDTFKVGTGLLTLASFTSTAHTTCEHLKRFPPNAAGGTATDSVIVTFLGGHS